jgi:hypothetical protein
MGGDFRGWKRLEWKSLLIVCIPKSFPRLMPILLQFLVPWARIGPYPGNSQDEDLGSELWKWCEEQVKDL